MDDDDWFEYSNFGDSFALEFASAKWVQCAYSPPYSFASYDDLEEDEEAVAGADDEVDAWEKYDTDVAAAPEPTSEDEALTRQLRDLGLEGSWNCPTEPPNLW